MGMKGWAVTMGVGAVVGAVAVMMMPRHNPARKLANRAAYAVEDAAQQVANKLTRNMDM